MEDSRIGHHVRAVALSAFLLSSLLQPAVGGGHDVRVQIREAVVAALGGVVKAEDVAIDPALRVAPCRDKLIAAATGPRNVEVQCPGAGGWRIYVPVRVEQISPVVVLLKGARAGEPLLAEQVTLQQRDVAGLRGAGYSDPSQVVGKVPLRGLPPGAILRTADLADQALLKRGDPVTIRVVTGGVSVSMEGRALGGATLGGRVNVENVSSRRIIRGRLTEPGVVQVGP